LELIRHFDDRAESPNPGPELRADQDIVLIPETGQMNHLEPAPLVDLLSMTPVPVDELVRQSGLPPSSVQLALLELELAGRLVRHAGARVSLLS
jgi:DNA processing protein